MVGFKSIWLILTLALFAACVPQKKQTECRSNEAFNAPLRTCVPVVNGPSSFINIDSYIPTSPLTKYKNDSTPITLSVVISNPYGESYTVVWERIYNGVPITITPTTTTSYTFAPSLLSTELGTHIIVVKIKDSSNNIVDSHNFQILINDSPKPTIVSTSVTPPIYASSYSPQDLPVDFEFTVYNNGASMAGAGYRTDWSVYKSGALFDTESDAFPTTIPLGSLTSTGYNYPTYSFDPASISTTIVGEYIIRARVTNTASEVVAEQQWSVTVTHPNLSKITSRDIYEASPSPAFSTLTKAFNGVAYTASTGYNFIPCTMSGGVCVPAAATQGDYCVQVTSGEGTYAGDGEYVRVDFYLDGGTIVYSGLTGIADDKVCLSDAAGAVLNSVVFNNASSTATQTHTIVARVVDEATGEEYDSNDMNGSLGSYPISWDIRVQPQNDAPTVDFGTMATVTCSSTSGNTKSGCAVASDTNFTVNIELDSDDFYSLPADEANFDYSIRLYVDGALAQTCTKSDPGYTGLTDVDGTDGYSCVFNIESYDSDDPIDTMNTTYQIQAEILDNGSPISATAATSSTLYWNFPIGSVTETNTTPVIANWSVSGAVNEGNNLSYYAEITDPELDNHTWVIEYCLDAACTTFGTFASGTIERTDNVNPYVLSGTKELLEDFLQTFTSMGCDQLARNATCSIDFRITVTDQTFDATPISVTSGYSTSVITNINPAPVLNITASNPIPTAFTSAVNFVGFPLSISHTPSSYISDASEVDVEKTFRYQWYAKNTTSVATWQAIDSATGHNLVWTSSLIKAANLGTDNPVSLMLCVEDQPVGAVPVPEQGTSVCSDATPWNLTVRNNVAVVHDMSALPSSTEMASAVSEAGTETAVWYELPTTFNAVTSSAAYIATFGNDQRIHIKKALLKDTGEIDTINATQLISFDAVPTGTVYTIKNLSITGVQSNPLLPATEVYVAYLASRTGSPFSFYPQVRRIDLTQTTAKLSPNTHSGKFGFDYDGLGFLNNCNPVGECTATAASGVSIVEFNPTGPIIGSFTLETPNGDFVVNLGVYNGTDTICSNCTGAQMATELAYIINASTDPLLAGYSADAVLNQVTINGASANDYFDASSHADARIADQMGKIYVDSTGNWRVPFINSSLGGSYNDKLSFYSGAVGAVINSAAVVVEEPDSFAGLATMDSAIKFDNYYDGTNLWIALISKTASAGKLYKVDPSNYAITTSDTFMSSDVLLDVQVAASTSYVYVGAQISAGSKFKFGIYDTNIDNPSEFEMDDTDNVEASTDTSTYFNSTSISSYKIIPYGSEARILAASKGAGLTYQLYMARLRKVSSVWTLSCGECDQISELGESASAYVQVGVSPVRSKNGASYRLSTDGSVNSQGIKDVAFISYGRIDSAVAGSCDPALGVINVEGEQIGSTSTYNGIAPDQDAGLYRSSIIRN